MKIKEFVDSNKGPVNKSILNELFVIDSEIPINMMGIKGCPHCKDQNNQTQLKAGSWTSAYACYNCNSIFFISWTDRMGGSHTDHVLIYKEKSSLLDKKLDNDVSEPIVSKESQEKHHEVKSEDLNNKKMENQKWKVGKHKSVVVSDTKIKNTNFPSPPNPEFSENSDIEYYGGFLICESVGNDKIAQLIAAAPELLKCLKEAIESLEYERNKAPEEWYEVIDKAEGRVV